MIIKAIARINAVQPEVAATPKESVEYIKKVFKRTGLDNWITKVTVAFAEEDGGNIKCTGRTKAGEIEFDIVIDLPRKEVTIDAYTAEGIFPSEERLFSSEWVGFSKGAMSHLDSAVKKLDKLRGEIAERLADASRCGSALSRSLAIIANDVKAKGAKAR